MKRPTNSQVFRGVAVGVMCVLCAAAGGTLSSLLMHVYNYRGYAPSLTGGAVFFPMLGIFAAILTLPGSIALAVFTTLRPAWRWRMTAADLTVTGAVGMGSVVLMFESDPDGAFVSMVSISIMSLIFALALRLRRNGETAEPDGSRYRRYRAKHEPRSS